MKDTKRFLQIKEHPMFQEMGIDIVNIEVNGRDPWNLFQKEIKPILDGLKKR